MLIRKLATLTATILVVGALVALVGCSDSSSTVEITAANVPASNSNNDSSNSGEADTNNGGSDEAAWAPESKFHITASGNDIYVGMPTAGFIDSLGDPESFFESESCAGQGMDKVYTYNDYVIRTFADDKSEVVTSIEFRNDSIVTSTNCYIGMDVDTIKSMHSDYECVADTDTALSYVDGNCKLSYIIADGEVSAITFNGN